MRSLAYRITHWVPRGNQEIIDEKTPAARVRANFIPLEWVIHSCPPFARISFQSKLWYTISVTVRTGETGMKIAISPNYINVKKTKNLHNRALQPWLSERQIVVVFRIEQRKHLLLNPVLITIVCTIHQ